MNENQIILTKGSTESDIRRYFEGVLQLSKSSEEFPVNLDEVWPLVYGQKGDAVGALKKKFEEGIDYKAVPIALEDAKAKKGGQNKMDYYLTTSCLEYFIARKVRPVFEVYRAVFHRVANSQTPALPDFSNPAEAARAWAEQYEQKMIEARRADEAEKQVLALSAEIESLQPKLSYYDTILASKETVTITQIAQDYGMSAVALNKTLQELKVQHKVNGQWILYAPFISQGYVHSKPVEITRTNGKKDVKMNTEWTQKGRLFLYNGLKNHGILPLIER
ncbi:Phage antirepressor protein YoqD, KilAC domain [Prevotella sp. tc2-28]|uniref:phage antirepressor KilAC domain-containing protein n=1 Tax=Prevotella sp. tc2-28 TaxID=1761888 RepID=UPI00089DA606|nr:phage antirepressor KilAC domain-containing protein [Prevotella sp. tc2-28]SEA81197.1 Phage antirepressor protein YoqD, KilAC domain [Prevotella sp. tc2-28]